MCTRPYTLVAALAESLTGLLAWIVGKYSTAQFRASRRRARRSS
jgi:hypothetical protein